MPNPSTHSPGESQTSFDVLVVGSGAAGLYASLCLPANLRVGLITKGSLDSGSSPYAQGGIAAAINPPDSTALHLEDTLKAGAGLCDRAAVQFLVENAATAIANLLELGVNFDRTSAKLGNRHDSELATTLEAAHSQPRVLHSKDTTGRAIVDVLRARVLERSNISIFEEAVALSLWLHPQTGRCRGIQLLQGDRIFTVASSAVVLATGGGGQVFAKTTNPAVSTGDGVAMAWRAGAVVRDLEFVQFHPTALMKPGAPHFLISEAVRGEGAHLVDEEGKRFAFDYHPAGELAPRDVVSRAIFTHLQSHAENPARARVYLDLQTIEPAQIRRRFPNIVRVCQQWGIDAFAELMPVAPAAHYWMGGIACDVGSRTSIAGLYAIGETASTGVHGANRLASNSLLECLVFAAQLSHLEAKQSSWEEGGVGEEVWVEGSWAESMARVRQIREQLPDLMWESAGICRYGEKLEKAIAIVGGWREEVAQLDIARFILSPLSDRVLRFFSPDAPQHLAIVTETLNLLDIGYLILKSAVFRTESRGGHYRQDYPETLQNWQVHTLVQGDRWWTEV
ncbi:MAG: L-aspartate oxidase [Cyanobacteriota bacterium]|nr:L-aspartate oxidase [Cyanobacteriota bacterium]